MDLAELVHDGEGQQRLPWQRDLVEAGLVQLHEMSVQYALGCSKELILLFLTDSF